MLQSLIVYYPRHGVVGVDQWDQIGRFIKVLRDKLSDKSRLNICRRFGLFRKKSIFV